MEIYASGGAPVLGEPLGVEFANTRYALRGAEHEGLAEPGHLAGWLLDHDGAFEPGLAAAAAAALTPTDLESFRGLRDAIRELARHAVTGARPARPSLDLLNAAAAAAPRWPRLHWDAEGIAETQRTAAPPTVAALAAIARSAIAVLGGPSRAGLRACEGPGCVLFFVRDHPRREWCSPGCGNRARVGRHYARRRAAGR